MFAGYQTSRGARRGVILIVVLGMLGLLALIGVTFATFSGQARISARNFSLAHDTPEPSELMDFALSQLIDDTFNPVSAIRGHSLKRDMYGNDATTNGYLTGRPDTGAPLAFTGAQLVPAGNGILSGLWACALNVPAGDPAFYGYDFTRWIVRVAAGVNYSDPLPFSNSNYPQYNYSYPYWIAQSFEVIVDDNSGQSAYGNGVRVLYLNPPDGATGIPNFISTMSVPAPSPPTSNGQALITQSSLAPLTSSSITGNGLVLDGRYLRAFNGPGLSALVSYYASSSTQYTNPANVFGNFRVNGALLGSPYGPMGDPDAVGMDEDYDACDLDNWFLAIQSADGQTIIPSFHRPAIIRADPTSSYNPPNAPWSTSSPTDWNNFKGTTLTSPPAPADSMARILRPRTIDGHSLISFPDLLPDASGKITYDVDNDGDGNTDSVWLDLGYPARRDPTGRLFKPLYAFLIIGLNGRIPLNTAGNLQDINPTVTGLYPNLTTTFSTNTSHSSSRLGYSPSEIDPSYALQNASVPAASNDAAPPPAGLVFSQVDNAGAYVNVTQLRNILTGTRPQSSVTSPSSANGDLSSVVVNGQLWYMPNGQADNLASPPWGVSDTVGTDQSSNPAVVRNVPSVGGRWGESGFVPLYLYSSNFSTTIAAGLSLNYSPGITVGIEDDNFTAFDPTGRAYDFIDLSGSLAIPTERVRRFGSPIDLTGNGLVVSYSYPTTSGTTGYGPDAFGRVMFQEYFRPSGRPTSVGNVAPTGTSDLTTNPLRGFDAARNPLLITAAPGATPAIPTGIAGDHTLIAAAGTGGGQRPQARPERGRRDAALHAERVRPGLRRRRPPVALPAAGQ
ncbi:MAG: hypothetical protein P4L84_27910 [Isosphaeraceae bacterium]|nr:hypothetical protein [Isosphaeraceae bacterium]